MTFEETMRELEKPGAPNRKTTKGQGAGLRHITKLQKRIGIDHVLAGQLWSSGNSDAQTLAILISDPTMMSENDLDLWVNGIRSSSIADRYTEHLVIKTSHARVLMTRWMSSKQEYVKRCGYCLLALTAGLEESLTDQEFFDHIWNIVKDIHDAPNRAKEAMHLAVIAIGRRNKRLNKEALFGSMQIGPVLIDHGEDTDGQDFDALKILTDKKLQKQLE